MLKTIAAVVVSAALTSGTVGSSRAVEYASQTLSVWWYYPESTKARPVMVTIFRDGSPVAQYEDFDRLNDYDLKPGSYFVRVEGVGFKTQTKGPYLIFEDRGNRATIQLEEGSGAKVIEYAEGAMSREEIATRLKRLEEAVAKLSKGGEVR